jgi:hypothetical protein
MGMSKEALALKAAYNREWYRKNIEHARELGRERQKRFWERKAKELAEKGSEESQHE